MNRSTGLLDHRANPIGTADIARARASANSVHFAHANEGASRHGTFLAGWHASLRSADADSLPDRNQIVARARDLSRNDPVAASAVQRKVNGVIGFQWRLSSRVNALALGIDAEEAARFGALIETHFNHFAYGPTFQSDAERKKTFAQQLRLSAAHIFQDGEALGVIEYAADEPTRFKTRLRMVDPDRLSNPNGIGDSATLRGGVERSTAGIPIRYWIREGHPNDLGATQSMIWRGWERYATPLGRPQVLHAFDEMRAGQSRGISRFVSALKAFRALQKFTDATLEAATINAMLVAFVKSNAGPQAVSESFSSEDFTAYGEERQDFYRENAVSLAGAKIPVLPLGDEIEMQTSARDTGGFDQFTRSILRLIAAALGLTYEELSMDFSQTNYSSARAAMAVAWSETLAFRGLIAAQIANPFYVAWLEEAFDNGTLAVPAGAPDFYDAIDAYAECQWIGPARGYIDPTKEIDAAAARIEAGVSTLEDECAEQGKYWEDVLRQAAREQKLRQELGLTATGPALLAAGVDARNPLRDQQLDQTPAPKGSQ